MADRRFPELPRQGYMLRVVEMLPSKEDNLPLQKRLADLAQLVLRQRLGEVNPADFRADMQRERCYVDRSRCVGTATLAKRRGHLLAPFPRSQRSVDRRHYICQSAFRRDPEF
jgi:hypothetical protein